MLIRVVGSNVSNGAEVADANEANETDEAIGMNEANEVSHSPSQNIFQSLQNWRNILASLKLFFGACTPSEFKVRMNMITNLDSMLKKVEAAFVNLDVWRVVGANCAPSEFDAPTKLGWIVALPFTCSDFFHSPQGWVNVSPPACFEELFTKTWWEWTLHFDFAPIAQKDGMRTRRVYVELLFGQELHSTGLLLWISSSPCHWTSLH